MFIPVVVQFIHRIFRKDEHGNNKTLVLSVAYQHRNVVCFEFFRDIRQERFLFSSWFNDWTKRCKWIKAPWLNNGKNYRFTKIILIKIFYHKITNRFGYGQSRSRPKAFDHVLRINGRTAKHFGDLLSFFSDLFGARPVTKSTSALKDCTMK